VSGNSNEPVYFIIPIVNCPTTSTSSTSTSSTSTSSTSTSSTSTSSTSTSSTSTSSTSSTSTTSTTTSTTTPAPAANVITFQAYQVDSIFDDKTILFNETNSISFLSWGDGYYQYGGSAIYSYNYAGNTLPNSFNGYINPNGTNLTSVLFSGTYNSIDISKCNTLTKFTLRSSYSGIPITLYSINFISNTNLERIEIESNTISSLNVNNLNKLSSLIFQSTPGYSLNNNCDFSTNISLTYIDIRGSSSTSFPILPPTKIRYLHLSGFRNLSSKSFTYSNNPSNLEVLSLGGNSLTSLDLSICTALKVLSVGFNNLTSLNLANQTLLDALYVSYNNILNIDTSTLSYLSHFSCEYNPSLSSLNLSSNTMLRYLYCSDTNLSSLNLYSNLKMEKIYAEKTKITSVILPANNNIYYIRLTFSKLTTSSVNYILANAIANVAGKQPGFIFLNNQTPPAPPTGQGIIDKNKLIALGWKVETD
jgi:hypothetical protein